MVSLSPGSVLTLTLSVFLPAKGEIWHWSKRKYIRLGVSLEFLPLAIFASSFEQIKHMQQTSQMYKETYQSIARILDPGNSRENQLEFFSLDHEKWLSISRSRLEKQYKKFSFSSWSTRLKERISRLEKWDFHSNFSIKVDVLF